MADWHCGVCMAPRSHDEKFCPDCENDAGTIDELPTPLEEALEEIKRLRALVRLFWKGKEWGAVNTALLEDPVFRRALATKEKPDAD